MNPSPAAATSTVLSTSKDSFNKFPSPSKEFCVATSSASLAYDSMPKLTRTAIVPTSLPFLHGPYVGLSQAQATLLTKERISFPPNSLPLSLSPRGALYPSPIYSRSAHFFGLPPTIVRPIPTSGLPWPLHPVPLRVPFALRPDFGVRSPEEIPSPPGSALPDMPTSPLMGVRSPGLDVVRGLSEGCLGGVDVNNNSGICMGDGEDDDGSKRSQGFKVFLESAKISVEMINDGNGLKNPLLSAEKTRLPLDNGPLSFMTLDAFPACPVCGMKCDTPRLLQRHVRSHKEIKRYLCAWCGKGFNDTFDLKRHTRTHTGVRPYKCEACGKAFTQRCSLESHSRKIHGQALPFTFNERRAKLYVCEECGHSTSNIESHFRHLRAQHPGHPALGRPHHDRRQYKFCGEDGEMEEGEEEEEGGEGRRMEEGEEEEGGSWGQFQNETAVTR
ncbi:hypothetical protein V1264_004702 [Littorina saxatilis]|uniref:C2H2-type domain-containing protein n=2 Tax=Littorina saxatilis TaxID=31220 RepID=A0AAN9G755_9CAEN